MQQPVAALATTSVAAAQASSIGAPEKAAKAVEVPADNTVTIKSPMIGTFYRSASPDKPPFINVGDDVDLRTKVGRILQVKHLLPALLQSCLSLHSRFH